MTRISKYHRKSVSEDKIRFYSKEFELNASGLKQAETYERNSSPRKLPSERLNILIDKSNKTITIYTQTGFPVPEINVIGTSSVSKIKGIRKSTGSFVQGFGPIINDVLNCVVGIKKLTIDYQKGASTSLSKRGENKYLLISGADYNYCHGLFQTEKKITKDNSKVEIIKHLNKKVDEIDIKSEGFSSFVSNDFRSQVFKQHLSELSKNEIKELIYNLYTSHSDVFDSKIELFKETDTYKLDYIIKEYERHLKEHKNNEAKWQKFYEENFSLINPGYKYVIREVDTIFASIDVEASSRPVDLIAIDIYNRVELIELKTPATELIANRKNRNNYYLHNSCTKACTQLEKYLLCFETNQEKVEKEIRRKISNKYSVAQKNINLIMTKPKAKLIIGEVKPILTKPSRHRDLQLQRHSFKNIELITFDEILNSLKEVKRELKSS